MVLSTSAREDSNIFQARTWRYSKSLQRPIPKAKSSSATRSLRLTLHDYGWPRSVHVAQAQTARKPGSSAAGGRDGKQWKLGIKGGFPAVSLKQAQEEAARFRGMLGRGEDPREVRFTKKEDEARQAEVKRQEKARIANTFEKVALEWLWSGTRRRPRNLPMETLGKRWCGCGETYSPGSVPSRSWNCARRTFWLRSV